MRQVEWLERSGACIGSCLICSEQKLDSGSFEYAGMGWLGIAVGHLLVSLSPCLLVSLFLILSCSCLPPENIDVHG